MNRKTSIAVAACLLAQTSVGAQPRKPCPLLGATYTARAASDQADRSYRLQTEALPRGTEGAAFATLFRFQTLSRRTGRRLNEIRMWYACPNGGGNCSVSPPARPGPDGGLYSEVIGLNRDWTLTAGQAAPYALVLPGFAEADWLFTPEEMASPDLTVAAGARSGPDYSRQVVWTLDRCGRAG